MEIVNTFQISVTIVINESDTKRAISIKFSTSLLLLLSVLPDGRSPCVLSVSYTHLDVYKRQIDIPSYE